jgi:hypothetical protein
MNADDELGIPSADGIRRCLRLLADEAAELKLNGTFSAIEAALAVIAAETRPGSRRPAVRTRHGHLLH